MFYCRTCQLDKAEFIPAAISAAGVINEHVTVQSYS